MKRVVLTAVMSLLLFNNFIEAQVSWIANNSFEYDEEIGNIRSQWPTGWDDVNVPLNFYGSVTFYWSSDPDYSLLLRSNGDGTFFPDDIATISQDVYMADVDEIIFDIRLDTSSGVWDPSKRRAFIKIEDVVVWSTDDFAGVDLRGTYLDEVADISGNETIRDGQMHVLTLGLESKVSEAYPMVTYFVYWDLIGFDSYCRGGIGFLEGDFNRDCFVNESDLKELANHWLFEVEDPNKYDLYDSNMIDFMDYSIFAQYWMGSSYVQDEQYLEGDINMDGIVNFVDYAMLIELGDIVSGDVESLEAFVDDWLKTNWMYGK
jgi:hypothetical protein